MLSAKIGRKMFYHRVMLQKDEELVTNSKDIAFCM